MSLVLLALISPIDTLACTNWPCITIESIQTTALLAPLKLDTQELCLARTNLNLSPLLAPLAIDSGTY